MSWGESPEFWKRSASVRVKFRRPGRSMRSRLLLALAVLIPVAGFFQVAGPNPITLTAGAILAALALAIVYDALRPVLVMSRRGLVIRRVFGSGDIVLPWDAIETVDAEYEIVSITTKRTASQLHQSIYQLELNERSTAVISRTFERSLVSDHGRRS